MAQLIRVAVHAVEFIDPLHNAPDQITRKGGDRGRHHEIFADAIENSFVLIFRRSIFRVSARVFRRQIDCVKHLQCDLPAAMTTAARRVFFFVTHDPVGP